MIDAAQAGSAFLLGLSGAGHCLGMCGGIAVALNLGGQRSTAMTCAYHGGRLASYTALGALLGFAAGTIDIHGWTLALRYLAGLLLIGMGLYVGNWWLGMAALERIGARLWQPVQRLSSRWLPLQRWPEGFALGLCWGLMPCGLIYSALAWAGTTQAAGDAALVMLLFGAGTLPAMLGSSFGAARMRAWLQQRALKRMIALLLIGAGAWTLYITLAHSGHSPDPEHHHGAHSQSQKNPARN